jgi:hypothetical protein
MVIAEMDKRPDEKQLDKKFNFLSDKAGAWAHKKYGNKVEVNDYGNLVLPLVPSCFPRLRLLTIEVEKLTVVRWQPEHSV